MIKLNSGSDPETERLTQQDRDHNTEVTRVRIVVEHVIGNIKRVCTGAQAVYGDCKAVQ